MKKCFLSVFLTFLCFALLSACGKYDYSVHISDEKSDLFRAECEEFTLTVTCVSREYPYLCDGVAANKSDLLEAVLTEPQPSGAEYEIYFLEDVPRGGDMSFRSVTGDYYYSRSVETFPDGALSVKIVKNGVPQELLLTSVKTEDTLSPEQALQKAIAAEQETVDRMTEGGAFCGEFHVRLLRRDKNYYYVGIVDRRGGILALLLDAETGEVLARRQHG